MSEGEYVGKMKSDDWDWYDKVYHPTCSLFPSTCSLPCRSMCKYGDRQNKKMVTCTPVRGRKRKIVVTSAYSFTFERRLLLLPFVERCFVAFLVSV